jgi:hypothetical protein
MKIIWKTLLAAALWLAAASPASAAWLRAESDNSIVYGEMSEERLRRQVVDLEDYAQMLRTLMRIESPPASGKLRVYLVRGGGELNLIRQRPAGVGGVYISGPDGIAAVVDVNANRDNPTAVLFHEYAHHFMMQYTGRVYPPWYIEGFAEYMMTARFTSRAIEFGHVDPGRAATLSDPGRWLPMENILFGGQRRTAEQHGLFYAQSWLLTHYLLDDAARLEQFRAYLAALARAEEPRAAFQASFGMTPDQLERQLKTYAFGRLTFRRLDRSSAARPPQVAVTRLPESADRLVLLQGALHVGVRDEGQALGAVRREAARHSDPFARRVLAQAEALHGDGAVADRLIDELLALSPRDSELMYFRGMRYLRASETADGDARTSLRLQARTWFSRAHRIDGRHFQTLFRYLESRSEEPGFVSAANLEVMLLAQSLAPQVGEIRMAAARMLMLLDDFELAERMLAPLAGSAHEGGQTAAARELLAKARARSKEGIGFIF